MDKRRKLLVNELVKHINNSIIQPSTVFIHKPDDISLCAINPETDVKIYFKKYIAQETNKYEILFSGYGWYTLPENEQLFNLAMNRYKEQINKHPDPSLYDAEQRIGLYKILQLSNNNSNGR